MISKFLTTSKDPEKSGVFWNMAASMMVAFQSVFLLIVMTHTVGTVLAGIYTMGNTDANLFLSIGKYGTRFFQVSDVRREYKFRDYRMARVISTVAMAIVSTIYVLYAANRTGYSSEKTQIIIWMCMFKLPDSFEDVYYGDYQKNERLDVASKALALRMMITIALFVVLLFITRSLLTSVIISTIVTILLMILFLYLTREFVAERDPMKMTRVWKLLLVTLPLCVGSFLTIYIGAAPRNSIDRYLDDTSQLIYGCISMPVFVVQLLVTFIFNPMLYKISVLWDEMKLRQYIGECFKQVVFTVVITIICIAGAWLLGVPVLSIMYNTDLAPYKSDLMILMVGSGFLGLAGLMANLLTVMRYQNAILVGYAIVSVVAFLFADRAVLASGITGAAEFYLILLISLSMIFLAEYIYGIFAARRRKRKLMKNGTQVSDQ